MTDRTLSIEGIAVPRFLYGTAWKEDETQRLTELALQQGFRGIDTANRRRHYHEAAVGLGISSAIKRGVIARDDLFLQTKFTFRDGQDHRLPYDPKADIPKQVEQSFASSLEHLGTDRIDSYVLHGPSQRIGLGLADWDAWRAMESLQNSGKTRFLGISNVTLEQLPRSMQESTRSSSICPEPVLRRSRLGSRCQGVLQRQSTGLPGLFTAHRKPSGDSASGVYQDC